MSNIQLYGSLNKSADLMEYVGAANRGAGIALNGGAPALSPIKAMKGMFHGAMGHYAQKHGYGDLQQQGVAFDTDAYGLHPKVNAGQTISNVANKGWEGVKSLFSQNGLNNAMSNVGNFISNNKGSLLGGAALLGGGYMLNNLFKPKPKMRYSQPIGYMDQQGGVPQAFQKAAQLRKNASSFGFVPKPIELPQRAAQLVTDSLDIPGLSTPSTPEPQMSQPQPYQPKITTDNNQLKKTLQDPRMRQYLTSLIQQVENNRTTQL